MTMNRPPVTDNSLKQKIIAGIIAVVFLIIIWQLWGMFAGSNTTTPDLSQQNVAAAVTPPPQQKPLAETADKALTPREQAIMQLQEETQAKYLAALNELQMLKLNRDIAEMNQAISTAKLSTVENQKKIVDILSPPAPTPSPADYAKSLVNPAGGTQTTTQTQTQNVAYTVISVSRIRDRWNAVIGAQGSLFSVSAGDVLPPDGSVVLTIDRSGVLLERDNVKRKISLVPII